MIVGLVVLVVAAASTTALILFAGASLEDQAFAQLRSVRENKAAQIESAIQEFLGDLVVLSDSRASIEGLTRMDVAFDGLSEPVDQAALDLYYAGEFAPRVEDEQLGPRTAQALQPKSLEGRKLQDLYIANNPNPVGEKDDLVDAGDGSEYSAVHSDIHPFFSSALENFEAYDIFLIDRDGTIVYSVFKEIDVGTNLETGPLRLSGLADAFRGAQGDTFGVIEGVSVTDFAPYLPSYNAPAAFAATQVFGDDGEPVGTVAMQFPVERINDVMTSNRRWAEAGLGESGETYIVAADLTMRNDSRFLIEDPDNYFAAIEKVEPASTVNKIKTFNSTIGLQTVDTDGVRDALFGFEDEQIFPDYRGVRVLSSFRPLNLGVPELDWVIMSEIDEAEAFAAETELIRTSAVVIAGVGLLLAIGIAVASKRVTDPLHTLETETASVETFDFTGMEPYDTSVIDGIRKRRDEIGDLAGAFSRMTLVLGENIRTRSEAEAELGVAAEIQESMLPLTFPAFTQHVEFQVHARLIPAKEIGGDFFEHGFVDDDHFFVVVGDVSGKGVPAALFMAAIKTLIRSGALQGEPPDELLTRINGELARENSEMMFATVWIGVLDLRDGTIIYTNAGHNPPAKITKDGVEWVDTVHGPMVGPIEGVEYTSSTMSLGHDDTLVVFSDGVTEAMTSDADLYGEERLQELLSDKREVTPKRLTKIVIDDVLAWEQGGVRSDDVTVLVLTYLAVKHSESFEVTIPTTPGGDLGEDITHEIAVVNERLAEFAAEVGVPDTVVQRAQIVIDEILVNSVSYSHATGVAVRAWTSTHALTLEMSDDGDEYNPLNSPEPDVAVPMEERQIGGLGIHLVKNLASEIRHAYSHGQNFVTVVLNFDVEES
jgi:serine phosphatase RsbU (regulator of sigma subunit)/anti-sigma regulatory factor (Ser/Thr protein kinase)